MKIVVTVPLSHADEVRTALAEAGAGKAGNYSHCSFSIRGTGRFLPQDGAQPHIGEVGKLESVAEERVEVLCERSGARKAVEAMLAAHPYEEPMYEIYPLLQLDDL